MSQKLPWFRMYVDFLNDPKMIALAFEDQRHFIGLLALKSDGALDMDIDDALLDRIVAQRLWIDHGVIRDVKKRLVASGLIDTSWQPLAWGKRQARSDADPTGAERQRRFRDSKKQDALRNGDVTGTDKDKDKDKDTEAEKDKKTKGEPFVLPDWIPADAWAAFMEIRKGKRAKNTDYALRLLVNTLTKLKAAGHDPVDILNNSIKAGWSDVYPPKVPASAMTPARRNSPTGTQNTHKHAAAAATIYEGVWDAE